jgi:hypothetical protein
MTLKTKATKEKSNMCIIKETKRQAEGGRKYVNKASNNDLLPRIHEQLLQQQ